MESPRKFNDCYFYYYSTCTKGDSCVFRHEPSALGCETMCVQWQQGKCLDKKCKLRHMELRKNRKQIPCYWETQPGGCRKKHCPFNHKNPEARTDGIAPSQPVPANKGAVPTVSAAEEPELATAPSAPHAAPLPAPATVMPHELLWQQQPRQVMLDSAILGVLPSSELLARRGPPAPHDPSLPQYAPMPVDPLVVNFEEESDNESAPSSTPTKMVSPEESKGGKDQELLLLERIQAEAAAFYSYDAEAPPQRPRLPTLEPVLLERRTVRTNLNSKYDRLSLDEMSGRPRPHTEKRNSLDFKILSLDEIRARKRASEPQIQDATAGSRRKLFRHESVLNPNKVIKVVSNKSVVYKKLETENTSETVIPKSDSRKRTRSETSIENDVDINVELDDSLKVISTNVPPSKVRKVDEQNELKVKMISNQSEMEGVCDIKVCESIKIDEVSTNASAVIVVDDDIDLEMMEDNPIVVSDEDSLLELMKPNENITTYDAKTDENTIIDISKVQEDISNDSITPEIESSLKSAMPDVVASCHGDKFRKTEQKEDESALLNDTDALLDEDSL